MKKENMAPDSIDLERHGFIEASAGTGKTYTIERIVLRLLIEQKLSLSQLLIVTYTEKGAGELRDRLRKAIEKDLAGSAEPTLRRLGFAALDQFDQASISTIHGFCQEILRDYPFEQGHDFEAKLVSEGELLGPALREVQRRLWRQWLGKDLASALYQADYGGEKASSWENQVLEIGRRYQGGLYERLAPPLLPDWPGAGLNNKAWHKNLQFAVPHQLALRTIEALLEQMHEMKQRQGWYTFSDMVRKVAEVLAEGNPKSLGLLDLLRRRYRFGIVDEFQDTNPRQWDIFRGIFLEGGTGKLLVVGDPKQSIFSFQGADLHTYHRALKTMVNQHGAAAYDLATNRRSCPELLTALNVVFAKGDWFRPDGDIAYRKVNWPEEKDQLHRLVRDETGRAALTVVDWREVTKWKLAAIRHGYFVAAEIDRLLHGPRGRPLLEFTIKGQRRQLQPGDIAVLVFTRAQASATLAGLRRRGIPYSFQKQANLGQSPEALHLELILKALVNAHDPVAFRKALLTPFFRCLPEHLTRHEALPMGHPARELFARWLTLVENQAWGPFCQSLTEDTGILLAGWNDLEADRRRTNLLTLLHHLEQAAQDQQLDLRGVLEWLTQKRQVQIGDEDWQPVETERSRVKIMTVFSSKGLEFPVVFLAGGFTKKDRGPKTYHDGEQLVFDLKPITKAKAKIKEERLDEQTRLLYVALTRAMFKLYVPLVEDEEFVGRSGYAGPVATVLRPALNRAPLSELKAAEAQTIFGPESISPTVLQPKKIGGGTSWTLQDPLFPTLAPDLPHRHVVVRSFSSWLKVQERGGGQLGEEPDRAEPELVPGSGADDPWRGPAFGDMVHQILEEISFAEVGRTSKPADLLIEATNPARLIGRQVDRNVDKIWANVPRETMRKSGRLLVADLVWKALHTPLKALGGPLHAVADQDRLAELEFLFHEGPGPANSFWTGFMDLVVRQGNRFFLFDWKTNFLNNYDRGELQQSMRDNEYHRQFRLYLQALARWLRGVGQTSGQLAGVYYLYVRGLNGKDESSGVFFHQPTPEDLDEGRFKAISG